ncbi:MAG: hypothetical protein DI596_12575 [Azospira oryzae]|nr:MAG: hypothetical protein DI596_12575 [Azospira oryzae]PZP77393.1 MAG: hypothetical protein DI593_12575 [Azospira oryzae]
MAWLMEKRVAALEGRLRPRGRFVGAVWSGDTVMARDGSLTIERRAGEDAETFLARCRVELGVTEHDIFLVRRILPC